MTKAVVGMLLVGLLIVPSVFAATDYRSMTEEQLQQQRTTMSTMAPSEQQAFSEEWYRRYQRQPLQEQMRMREQKFGVTPGETTGEMMRQPLPSPDQQQPMSQPGGTVTREEMSRSTTTTERTMPGAAMQQQGMSQSSSSSMPMGQSGAMMGSSQADMGTTSSGSATTERYGQTRDYRTMSNEELNRMMRPENSNKLSSEERVEVRREFESRIQTFTPEERQRYLLGSSRDIQQ